jgi:hypothetical protein
MTSYTIHLIAKKLRVNSICPLVVASVPAQLLRHSCGDDIRTAVNKEQCAHILSAAFLSALSVQTLQKGLLASAAQIHSA